MPPPPEASSPAETAAARRARLLGWAIAVGAVLVAAVLRAALRPWLGDDSPFLIFTIPVLVGALQGGRGPGLLAAVLAELHGLVLFAWEGAFSVSEVIQLVAFAFVSAGIVLLGDRALRARIEAGQVRRRADRDALEAGRAIQRLQVELAQVARLSAMGTMASALAHELNQPLTAIVNYAETARPMLASEDAQDREMVGEMFDDLAAQGLRAGDVIRRLRGFIAHGVGERRPETLQGLVGEAVALALADAGGVALNLAIHPEAGPVWIERAQIQQVLVILVRNAVEAMADSDRRLITITALPIRGDQVRVSVSDSGPGIDPAIEARLFDSFVTTKTDGMGVGLAICRTIVEAHGGRIRAGAGPDGGAELAFTLPLAVLEVAAA